MDFMDSRQLFRKESFYDKMTVSKTVLETEKSTISGSEIIINAFSTDADLIMKTSK